MGKRGGRRPGAGRKPGPAAKTIMKDAVAAEIAARTAGTTPAIGKKRAIDVIEEFMMLHGGMAAHFQPTPPNHPPNPSADEKKFMLHSRRAVECARDLAPYQSPTLKAVAISMPPLPLPPDPKQIEGKVVSMDDPVALAGVYRRLVMASRK